MSFVNLKHDINQFDVVKKAFNRYVEPKYGQQDDALNKILLGTDRECEILFVDNKPEGLLVYKNTLQNEFGLEKAFELKTTLIFNPKENKGLGAMVLRRAINIARKFEAKYVYGTLWEKERDLLKRFEDNGWIILKKGKSDDNSVGVYVIYKKLPVDKSKL